MKRQRVALVLFWVGLVIAVGFASVGTWSLMHNLRTLTGEENDATIWAEGSPLFVLWALSVTLGSVVAGIGAFLYVQTKPAFSWLTAIGILAAVIAMVMVWSRVYNSTLFGIGGAAILIIFFAVTHGANGLRQVIEDYVSASWLQILLRGALFLIWLFVLIVAVYVVLTVNV